VITLQTGSARRHYRRLHREVWNTSYPAELASPGADGFGALRYLEEDRLPPGAILSVRHPRGLELVTFVSEGALGYEDPTGCAGFIRAGEFQRMSTGSGVRWLVRNGSQTDCVHLFRIWLGPIEGEVEPSSELKRFTAADRRGRLLVVASPDARGGSLRVQRDALVCSALLDPGQHVIHEMEPGRSAWIHVHAGAVTVGDALLVAGDGACITDARAVSLTARMAAAVLLVDLRRWAQAR
jgi:redox-sensitive bicupin YhaK (pirin superfamily)